jgi:hypothetical protein
MVLIGAEIALADETVDVSELPEPMRTRLGAFFATRPFSNNGQNNIHEYVHTQQRDSSDVLATRAVYEGVADFVAEQVTGKRPALEMYRYGPEHAVEIREHFVAQMDGTSWGDWFYNSTNNRFGVSDVGYYVGYEIARGFYEKAGDKQAAIREMIELDYADAAAVKAFIQRSGYLYGQAPGAQQEQGRGAAGEAAWRAGRVDQGAAAPAREEQGGQPGDLAAGEAAGAAVPDQLVRQRRHRGGEHAHGGEGGGIVGSGFPRAACHERHNHNMDVYICMDVYRL